MPESLSNQYPDHSTDPDVKLMLAFQKGDASSFEALMHMHYPRIFGFIYRFVGRREAAEDLTQEVFLRVYKSASAYQPQAKFTTWLYTIAKNICLNELRKQKRAPYSIDAKLATSEGELSLQIEDHASPDPQRLMEQEERVRVIKAAIKSLPETQRLAVILRRYEHLSYNQIAQALGISVPAVKSLLNRAKESLKIKLSGLAQS